MPSMELDIPRRTRLQIFRLHTRCSEGRISENLNRCVAFLQAYLITSARSGPDRALPAVQRVASPHVCVGVGYVGAEAMVALACL